MNKIQRLFHKACADYSLLEDGDRVLVALSGGKDSLMLVKLMGMQQRIYKPRIEVEAVHVIMDNIPYETDRSYIQRFCEEQGVKLTILHSSFNLNGNEQSEIATKITQRKQKTKCFLCSWNRRKAIFTYAKEHGFTKVALGHHQDDIITTLLMNMTFEGSMQTMPPRLKMQHYPLEIIRPLCLVPEKLIAEQARLLGFEKQKTPCPYDTVTKRKAINDIFHQLEQMNPEARYSLWHSMKNIHPELLP
ncbi:MAG: adenine nucleotide alpha hydrolase family protein [Prevotella sp.]|nr:adenine nucleotide alpha hydrolase family protein [Prevotella sp.]